MTLALDRQRIVALLQKLDAELRASGVSGEVYVVGGAVMCLVLQARDSTQDVDAAFAPTAEIRKCAQRVATAESVPANWLNDAAKGYLSEAAEFAPFLELPNLRVMTAAAEYLLAMKCLAMRLGAEFHDEADIRYLLRHLNLTVYQDVVTLLERYYPLERYPQKTLQALEEILGEAR